MKRITFFLLSLGFLCIPVIHCMEDDRETLEEHMDYVKHLTNHGQLIPGNHYQAANAQQAAAIGSGESTEAVNEGTNFLLALPCLIPGRISAQVTNPNVADVEQKKQPKFKFVTTKETDNNPDLFTLAYENGIVASPYDHEALYLAMKRFQNDVAEKSSTDVDAEISEESDSDN